QQVARKIGRHDDANACGTGVDGLPHLFDAADAAGAVEIAGVEEAAEKTPTLGVVRLVQNHRGDVVDRRVDGVAEENQLHQRHDQHNGQRARVAADLNELLGDD